MTFVLPEIVENNHLCGQGHERLVTALSVAYSNRCKNDIGTFAYLQRSIETTERKIWDIVGEEPLALKELVEALRTIPRYGAQRGPSMQQPSRENPHGPQASRLLHQRRKPNLHPHGKRRNSRSPSKAQRRALARASKKATPSSACSPECDGPCFPPGNSDDEEPPAYAPLSPIK